MSDKLKSCPFCNADEDFASYIAQVTAGDVLHYYECIRCKARGPIIRGGGFEGDPQTDAGRAWNQRSPGVDVEALRKALKQVLTDAEHNKRLTGMQDIAQVARAALHPSDGGDK